jgi:hypothetical protein
LKKEKEVTRMKKKFYIITMVAFLTLLLVSAITFVNAQGYTRISWPTQDIPTIDGMWTFETEWTDGEITMIGEDVAFRSTWDAVSMEDAWTRWVVEFFSDTTDDPDDVWQICIDGDQSMDSSPQPSDYKFEITGHTGIIWYTGTTEDWQEVTLGETEIEWTDSLSASPTNSTPHWILEFQFNKHQGTVQTGILWNIRVAVYDGSNPDAGVLAWPPDSDAEVPSTWGMEDYSSVNIPEGLSFGVFVLLSSVALIVTTVILRKRSRMGKSS